MTPIDEHNLEQLDLDRLKPGSYEFDFLLDDTYFHGIEQTEVLGGQVRAEARLMLRQSLHDELNLSLHLHVHGQVQLTCDRCLDPMDQMVEAEEDADTEDLLTPNEHILNLKWLAYELLAVHLPLVHRHPEGDCNPQMTELLSKHLNA